MVYKNYELKIEKSNGNFGNKTIATFEKAYHLNLFVSQNPPPLKYKYYVLIHEKTFKRMDVLQ